MNCKPANIDCQGYNEARIVSLSGANISLSDSLTKIGTHVISPAVSVLDLLSGVGGIGHFDQGLRSGEVTLKTLIRNNAEYTFEFAMAGSAKLVPLDNFDQSFTVIWGSGVPKPTKPTGSGK